MIEPGEPGVRLCVGVPGAGKTYVIHREVCIAARVHPVIVIDRCYDWRKPPHNRIPKGIVAAAVRTTAEAIQQISDRGVMLAIVNPKRREGGAATKRGESSAMKREAEAACEWASAERAPGAVRGVVVHEAHNAFPNTGGGNLPEAVMDCATAWRHFDVAMWLDTQRLALLNTTFDLAGSIRLFAAADRDRARIREIGDVELEACVLEAGRRLEKKSRGGDDQPGWHVHLGTIRRPPYTLTRETK